MNDELKHIGTPRHSGRYPWGSGKDPEQRNTSLLGQAKKLKKQGLSDVEIAEGLGLKNTSELRRRKSIEREAQWNADSAFAIRLKDKGMSNVAIGKRMGCGEAHVRDLLNPILQQRNKQTETIAGILKEAADEKKYIDVGEGIEKSLGVSPDKLKTALALLKDKGYEVHYTQWKQMGTNKPTSMKVLAPPGVTNSEIYKNRFNIKMPNSYSEDGGETFTKVKPPVQIDSSRIHVRYAEDGGTERDGTIELRRGVPDIDLGNAKYAQVRIGVDGTHFMKGMAFYSDDIPSGKDIIYNVNKSRGAVKDKIFKPNETKDPNDPFGTASAIRQKEYTDANGKKHQSALNIINEEGDWKEYHKNLSSQVLSKQRPELAKKQLNMAFDLKKEEFDEINSLTNPAIKKRLIDSFADDCDSQAVHLKAAALPRQGWHVILPLPNIKENEIYAPNYNHGESVVLIRHPHGGTFEIPELTVNNNNAAAKKFMNKATDAVGIHPKVAEKLSGADFDGDTVLVIPNSDRKIITSESIRSLKNFNPKEQYKGYDGMPKMKNHTKQTEMGKISNLITDMTIKGANRDEIARAVKHSMVVIDAQKHNLDYKRSAIENNIADLKKRYQGGETHGSSTLISRAKSDVRVPFRKDRGIVTTEKNTNPLTGEKIHAYYTGETYINSQGKKVRVTTPDPALAKALGGEKYTVPDKKSPYVVDASGKKIYSRQKTLMRTTKTYRMEEQKDAFALSSGTKMETIYAEHANKLKDLANKSRLASLKIIPTPYSPSANKTYAKEVASLNASLDIAIRHKPLERQAQMLANKEVATKIAANPHYEPDDIKKLRGKELEAARSKFGGGKHKIEISDKEWEAIQAGAVTNNKLSQILLNTDVDKLKERAMPRSQTALSSARLARAKSMDKEGYTAAEIASSIGVSVDTLYRALNDKE